MLLNIFKHDALNGAFSLVFEYEHEINIDRLIHFIYCFNVIQYNMKLYSEINTGNIIKEHIFLTSSLCDEPRSG
jgi:hypothetical protein